MSYYYVAGLPCSNELYHHGIIGQKWGVRRFQNKDGSLTAEGRIRYGGKESTGEKVKNAVVNAGRAVGSTAKKTGAAVEKATKATANYVGKRFKMNHPSLLSDQELKEYTQRLIAEQNYSRMMSQLDSPSMAGHASRLVRNLLHDTAGVPFAVVRGIGGEAGNILKKGASTLADAGFRKIAQEMTTSRTDKEAAAFDSETKRKLGEMNRAYINSLDSVLRNPASTQSDIDEALADFEKYKKAVAGFASGGNASGGKKKGGG